MRQLSTKFVGEVTTIYGLLRGGRGSSAEERLESFYKGQAGYYDRFRERLLPGRPALIAKAMQTTAGRRLWIDLACGTGISLEMAGEAAHEFDKIILIDLSASLLEQAKQRVSRLGLRNVEIYRQDILDRSVIFSEADLVTCLYGLTMVPDWFRVINKIQSNLSEGGSIAVVDFYVSRKHPSGEFAKNNWFTRNLIPLWFELDNVYLSPDHLPYLKSIFQELWRIEDMHSLPYLRFLRAPYYSFIGKR